MYKSEHISVDIARPVAHVVEFLQDPVNFPRWASVQRKPLVPIGGRDYSGETPVGPRIIRFSEKNAYGVLDHAVFVEGTQPITTPMRAVANQAGTLLVYTLYQKPGWSDEQFISAREWVLADLLTLKSVLEAESYV